MKTTIALFVFCSLWITMAAQTPQAFKYQAVARSTTGEILADRPVSFRISIIKGSVTGTIIYTETHRKTTNAFGLTDLEIGRGTPVTGVFSNITWGNDTYYINIEMDPAGGTSFQFLGAGQLLSVPYALQAEKVEQEADGDPVNELQTLSLNGSQLTLSKGGGTVQLPSSGTGGDNWGSQTVATDATLSGGGLVANPLGIARQSATTGQVLKWDGITWKPGNDLTGDMNLPYAGTTNTAGSGFSVTNSNTAESSSGIYGYSSSASTRTYGVIGSSASMFGVGVLGKVEATTGPGIGVFGSSLSASGTGVFGFTGATAGNAYGVWGQSESPAGSGVFGQASAKTGINYGIYGWSRSTSGRGVFGFADAATGKTYGVYGLTSSDQGFGIYGVASSPTGFNCGVYGNSASGSGYGVIGAGWTGVRGETSSSSGYGLEGVSTSSTGRTMAILGNVSSPDGYSGYFNGGKFYISGNTGIGIENPGAKLDVAGQVKITGGNPGAGKILTSDANGLASWQDHAPAASPGGSNGTIQFNQSGSFGGDNNLYWNNSVKRLGIGTTTPARDLSIHGGDREATLNFTNNLTGQTWYDGLSVGIGNTNDGWTTQFWCYENFPLVFGTNNAWKMMIMPSGNVGIGKYQPPYKLDVVGNRIRLSDQNLTNEWIAMRTDGDAGILDLTYSGGKLAVGGSNTGEDLLLNPGTNAWVGVRTWVPQYELDVNGNIRATGSVYYGGTAGAANGTRYNTPDYVFAEEYEKLTTEEVAEFIQKENHLPWVTSAEQEKKENGEVINMTRMAFETLETAENLQLQLIQQQKQIHLLKAENEQLRAVNNAVIGRLERLEKLTGTTTQR